MDTPGTELTSSTTTIAPVLWDAAEVAAYLHCSRRTALDRLATVGAPAAVAFDDPHTGEPLPLSKCVWVAAEIVDWALRSRREPARIAGAADGAPERRARGPQRRAA